MVTYAQAGTAAFGSALELYGAYEAGWDKRSRNKALMNTAMTVIGFVPVAGQVFTAIWGTAMAVAEITNAGKAKWYPDNATIDKLMRYGFTHEGIWELISSAFLSGVLPSQYLVSVAKHMEKEGVKPVLFDYETDTNLERRVGDIVEIIYPNKARQVWGKYKQRDFREALRDIRKGTLRNLGLAPFSPGLVPYPFVPPHVEFTNGFIRGCFRYGKHKQFGNPYSSSAYYKGKHDRHFFESRDGFRLDGKLVSFLEAGSGTKWVRKPTQNYREYKAWQPDGFTGYVYANDYVRSDLFMNPWGEDEKTAWRKAEAQDTIKAELEHLSEAELAEAGLMRTEFSNSGAAESYAEGMKDNLTLIPLAIIGTVVIMKVL